MDHIQARSRWGIALVTLTSFGGGAYLYSRPTEPFANMQGTIHCSPSKVVRVQTESEVQALVLEARTKAQGIKAASPGWQGSNESSCVSKGGIQIDTSAMKQVLAVDRQHLTVRVQPGIKLWDLTQILHREYQVTLPAVQEFADVTLGGMLGNGTHGSSLQETSSSLQDRVLAVRLVDGQGEVRSLEAGELDYIGGNMGVLGILTEITIRVQPSFKVKAQTSAHDDTHLAEEILDFAAAHYAAAVSWFPGHQTYTSLAFDKVANETAGEAHNGQTEKPWYQRKLFPSLFKAAHLGTGNQLMCILEDQRIKMKSHSFFTEKFSKAAEPAVGWAHEMLSFVCRDRCPFDDLPFSLEEIAIPLDQLPRFIKQAQTLFDQQQICLPLNGIYFRFGRAARGAISMASGRDTAYVGMEYVRNPYGDHYPKDFEFIQELEQILLKDYQGRPHWGKNTDAMFTGIKNAYPRWDEFTQVRDQLDPEGIFKNAWFRTVSGEQERPEARANCVVNQACYCSRDQDCPASFSCSPGLIDREVRVCRKN